MLVQSTPGEDFLPNDEVPATLLPMIQQWFTEHVPVLCDTVEQLLKLKAEQMGKGGKESEVAGVELPRLTGFRE